VVGIWGIRWRNDGSRWKWETRDLVEYQSDQPILTL
jgi:hypothetical protein